MSVESSILHCRDPEVITKSEGKDPYRKVVVMLKKIRYRAALI